MRDIEDQEDALKFQNLLLKYSSVMHTQHYLIILLKRHLLVLLSDKFIDLEMEELLGAKKLCDDVSDKVFYSHIYSNFTISDP